MELLATMVNLAFWSRDFMLDEGIHPFRTVYVSTAKQAQDQANLQTYDPFACDGTICLEDLHLFQLTLRSHWPTEFLQLDTSLKLFHNLLSVILPATHTLLIAFSSFLNTWNGMHILLAEYFGRDRAKLAQFLRSIQLQVALYWQALAGATFTKALVIQPPDLLELLMSVSLQSWVPPTITAQDTSLSVLMNGSTPSAPAPAPAGPGSAAPVPPTGPAPAPHCAQPQLLHRHHLHHQHSTQFVMQI